jgi:hypothetical protein
MTELTRRRMKDSKVDVWHAYYGDVQVGRIGMRGGAPNDVDQWGWTCGFDSQRLRITEGTAPTFALARAKLEEAWQAYLPGRIDVQCMWTTPECITHDDDAVADSDILWVGTLLLRRRYIGLDVTSRHERHNLGQP